MSSILYCWATYYHEKYKMFIDLYIQYLIFLSYFNELLFPWQILNEALCTKFQENLLSGSHLMHPDMALQMAAFHNSVKAWQKIKVICYIMQWDGCFQLTAANTLPFGHYLTFWNNFKILDKGATIEKHSHFAASTVAEGKWFATWWKNNECIWNQIKLKREFDMLLVLIEGSMSVNLGN